MRYEAPLYDKRFEACWSLDELWEVFTRLDTEWKTSTPGCPFHEFLGVDHPASVGGLVPHWDTPIDEWGGENLPVSWDRDRMLVSTDDGWRLIDRPDNRICPICGANRRDAVQQTLELATDAAPSFTCEDCDTVLWIEGTVLVPTGERTVWVTRPKATGPLWDRVVATTPVRYAVDELELELDSRNDGPCLHVPVDGEYTVVQKKDHPDEVREWLEERKISSVLFDVDGNGTVRKVPTEWIGDGEPIQNSRRALALIDWT